VTRGPILVGFDFTEGSETALRQAQAIAHATRHKLIVVHVLPEAYRVRVLFPHQAGIPMGEQTGLEQKAIAALNARLTPILGAAPYTLQLETGTPHTGLLEAADRHKAGLIVLGPGETAQRVARSVGHPVLIARPAPRNGAVLAATDFSDPAWPAVRVAAREASRQHVPLRLLHCLDVDVPLHVAGEAGMLTAPPLSDEAYAAMETEALSRLKGALAEVGRSGETMVLRRSPGEGIVEAAAATPTALVVVGTRGRTGLMRLALGNVAEYVVSHAPCSVLVVPLGEGA
jgi:nucleotide-binding universal stress UspA family protein